MLASLVWLWFSTDGYFGSLAARLTVIVLLLIPAVIVSGVAAVLAGFLAPIVVGLVKVGIAVARWARGKRWARGVAVLTPGDAADRGE
ncbi:hypothetical protein ACWGBO_34520 [[Kitasatospora] papulosa]